MEIIENKEKTETIFPSEIPPIFSVSKEIEKDKEIENSGGSVVLYRLITTALIIVTLIAMRILTPEIYFVLDSWLTEKFTMPPAAL